MAQARPIIWLRALVCLFVFLIPVASPDCTPSLIDSLPELRDIDSFHYSRKPFLGGQNFTYCCLLAVRAAYTGNDQISISTNDNKMLTYTQLNAFQFPCGASYDGSSEGAPLVTVPFQWCIQNCGGWQKSKNKVLGQWIQPSVGFILPAFVFCLSMPRRTKLNIPKVLFSFDLMKIRNMIYAAVILAPTAAVIALADGLIWVATVFAMLGPMLLSGLYEAYLDQSVLEHLSANKDEPAFGRAFLLYAVLVGNLTLPPDAGPPNTDEESAPQASALERVEGLVKPLENSQGNNFRDEITKTRLRLKNMLGLQYSFGSAIGTPMIFYTGSYIFSLVSVFNTWGDNDTSHALAFGMWWMVIPHVAIISGCLLAGNNPLMFAGTNADHIGRVVKTSNLSIYKPVYDSGFQPGWMWERGRIKRNWIKRIIEKVQNKEEKKEQNKEQNNLQAATEMGFGVCADLIIITLVLEGLPFVLAFLTSFYTPEVGLSCRSFTFLLYFVFQLWTSVFWFWDFIQNEPFRLTKEVSLKRFGEKFPEKVHIPTVYCTLMAIGIAGSMFTAIGGTFMQIVGVYRNCVCDLPMSQWGSGSASRPLTLSSNSRDSIHLAKKWWLPTGVAATVVLIFIVYVGWWYQRHMKIKFNRIVDELDLEKKSKPKAKATRKTKLGGSVPSSSASLPSPAEREHFKELKNDQLGIIDTPFLYIPNLDQSIRRLYHDKHLDGVLDGELLVRDAFLARANDPFDPPEVGLDAIGSLNEIHRRVIETHRHLPPRRMPKDLLVVLMIRCLGALAQGWDQQGIAGANLVWRREVGMSWAVFWNFLGASLPTLGRLPFLLKEKLDRLNSLYTWHRNQEERTVQSAVQSEEGNGILWVKDGNNQGQINEDLDYENRLLGILAKDEVLRPLYEAALEKMDNETFIRNLSRSIKAYCIELRSQLPDNQQKGAIVLLQSRATWIATQICRELNPSHHELHEAMAELISQKPDKPIALDRWIKSDVQGAKELPAEDNPATPLSGVEYVPEDSNDGISESGSSSNSDDIFELDYSEFPNIDRIETFLANGPPFDHFRDNFRKFVYPTVSETTQDTRGMQGNTEVSPNHNDPLGPTGQGASLRHTQRDWRRLPYFVSPVLSSARYLHASFRKLGGPIVAFAGCSLKAVFSGVPLPKGVTRLEWTCRCGHTSYDDFREGQPGAIAALEQELRRTGHIYSTKAINHTQGHITTLKIWISNIFICLVKRMRWSGNPLSLPGSEPRGQTNRQARPISPPNVVTQYLLLCVNRRFSKSRATVLQQPEVVGIKSDYQLFVKLKEEYLRLMNKSRSVLTTLKEIHFVQFEIRPRALVDRLLEHRLPPFPHDDYEFIPPLPGTEPPIGSEYMLHLYNCPEAGDISQLCLTRFPKKKKDMLVFDSEGENNTGWGILFKEGPHIALLNTLYFAVTLVSGLAFSIYWVARGHSTGDAFAVSGFIAAIGTMGLYVSTSCMRG